MNAVKWTATVFIIIATLARTMEYHYIDLLMGSIGTAMWAYIAFRTKENALLAVNMFCLTILTVGLIK